MSKPTTWKSPSGEEWVLADVAPVLRAAAVTISFGTGTGPWWEVLPIARQVLNDAANAHRQSEADWAAQDPRIDGIRAYAEERVRNGARTVSAIRIGSDLLELLGENEGGAGVRRAMDLTAPQVMLARIAALTEGRSNAEVTSVGALRAILAGLPTEPIDPREIGAQKLTARIAMDDHPEDAARESEYRRLRESGLSDYEARESVWPSTADELPRHDPILDTPAGFRDAVYLSASKRKGFSVLGVHYEPIADDDVILNRVERTTAADWAESVENEWGPFWPPADADQIALRDKLRGGS